MSQNHTDHTEWQACQPGELGQMVHGLRDRRRAVATQRRTVAAVVLLMTAFTGYYFVGVLPNAEPNYGGIVCSHLQELAPQYMAKTLDAETSAQIREHLVHCQSCRNRLEQLTQNSMRQSGSRVTRPHEGTAVVEHNRDANASLRVALGSLASLTR